MCKDRERAKTSLFHQRSGLKMKVLDLFSGLGGASEAMLSNGWEVQRIENNMLLKGVPNTNIIVAK